MSDVITPPKFKWILILYVIEVKVFSSNLTVVSNCLLF